jgi:hypothetical protein
LSLKGRSNCRRSIVGFVTSDSEVIKKFRCRGEATAPVTITVATLADLFLDWCKDANTAETYDWYKRFLQEFCELHGSLDVASLKPFHVNGWVKRWKNPTTRP